MRSSSPLLLLFLQFTAIAAAKAHNADPARSPSSSAPHAVSSDDRVSSPSPKSSWTTSVPHFVEHLIPKHPTSKTAGPTDPTIASHTTHHNTDQEDHSLHGPGRCRQSMQIENSLCDYDTVETINQELRAQLSSLVQQKFFRFYKLNLYGTCPFWTENHLCTNRDCGVAVIDEGRIPEEWTSASLGAISSPSNGMMFQPFKRCQLKDQDFCQVEDEALSEGVYVDLMENPERFTGYSGPSAARVWDAIYNENCFNVAQKMQMESKCEQCSLDRQANEELLARDLKAVARNGLSMAKNPLAATRIAPNQSPDEAAKVPHAAASSFDHTSPSGSPTQPLGSLTTGQEEVCLEKRVFYRMISGLHASISIHICDEYFNQTSGTWGPNLECFVSRVGTHPDRLENIYFDYAILVRAVTKLSGYLKHYEFCTGNPQEDAKVKAMVDRLIETSAKSPAVFDEKAMFVGPGAQALKMEFRDHFRNISKIMDCVGCEKCRLWGKVQTSGLGTALKVLFSYNDEHLNPIKNPNLLQRTEIVALFNAFNRLSESVESITKFRELYMQQYGQHWMAATSPDPSEPMQHPETKDHKMEQAGRLAKEEKENSPGIWPLFLSALEKCPGCRVASSERPLFLANMLPTNINHVLQDTRAWIVATGSVVRDLILDLYHHPVLLFRGEQTRTRIQSTGEDAGVSI